MWRGRERNGCRIHGTCENPRPPGTQIPPSAAAAAAAAAKLKEGLLWRISNGFNRTQEGRKKEGDVKHILCIFLSPPLMCVPASQGPSLPLSISDLTATTTICNTLPTRSLSRHLALYPPLILLLRASDVIAMPIPAADDDDDDKTPLCRGFARRREWAGSAFKHKTVLQDEAGKRNFDLVGKITFVFLPYSYSTTL